MSIKTKTVFIITIIILTYVYAYDGLNGLKHALLIKSVYVRRKSVKFI